MVVVHWYVSGLQPVNTPATTIVIGAFDGVLA